MISPLPNLLYSEIIYDRIVECTTCPETLYPLSLDINTRVFDMKILYERPRNFYFFVSEALYIKWERHQKIVILCGLLLEIRRVEYICERERVEGYAALAFIILDSSRV